MVVGSVSRWKFQDRPLDFRCLLKFLTEALLTLKNKKLFFDQNRDYAPLN